MLPLYLVALASVAASSLQAQPPSGGDPEPAVRLWINNDGNFNLGNEAKVQVQSRDDGYLLVFNFDADGHLRVLFPLSPGDDSRIEAGRRYEIRGRSDRVSFVTNHAGDGLIYAAVSEDPYKLDDYVVGGNWDYNRLSLNQDSKDPEADLTDMVTRMASDKGFDYDVVEYRVDEYSGGAGIAYGGPYYDDPYWCGPWSYPTLLGCRYRPGGWYIGVGYGWGWGWGSSYYWPYRYRYYGHYYPRHRSGVIIGRPRNYGVIRRGYGNNWSGGGRSWGGGNRSWGGSGGRRSSGHVGGRPRHDDLRQDPFDRDHSRARRAIPRDQDTRVHQDGERRVGGRRFPSGYGQGEARGGGSTGGSRERGRVGGGESRGGEGRRSAERPRGGRSGGEGGSAGRGSSGKGSSSSGKGSSSGKSSGGSSGRGSRGRSKDS